MQNKTKKPRYTNHDIFNDLKKKHRGNIYALIEQAVKNGSTDTLNGVRQIALYIDHNPKGKFDEKQIGEYTGATLENRGGKMIEWVDKLVIDALASNKKKEKQVVSQEMLEYYFRLAAIKHARHKIDVGYFWVL